MTSDCDNAFCSQVFSIPTGTKENGKPCKNQGFPTKKSIGVTGFEPGNIFVINAVNTAFIDLSDK